MFNNCLLRIRNLRGEMKMDEIEQVKQEKMGFFSKLKNSITNPAAYNHFLKESTGRAVVYLLLLCLIFGGISAIRNVYDYNKTIIVVLNVFKEKVPNFKFENGELNVEGEMPIIMNEGKDSAIIIDTSGKTEETILDKYSSGTFISKTKFVQKKNSAQKTETNFEAAKTLTITNADVEKWIGIAKVGNVFIVIFAPIFFFGVKFIAAFIVSLLGLIVNAFCKAKVTYGEIYKLSIYALTFSIILKVFFTVIAVEVPYFWILYYGIPLIYLGVGLNSISKEQETSME
jgi:hypothetical protein